MNNLFKSQEEAIQWVKEVTPFAIKPKREAKTTFINPFTSVNAFEIITDVIGEEIFKLQEKQKIATNKNL
jgi:hypothetical protein